MAHEFAPAVMRMLHVAALQYSVYDHIWCMCVLFAFTPLCYIHMHIHLHVICIYLWLHDSADCYAFMLCDFKLCVGAKNFSRHFTHKRSRQSSKILPCIHTYPHIFTLRGLSGQNVCQKRPWYSSTLFIHITAIHKYEEK